MFNFETVTDEFGNKVDSLTVNGVVFDDLAIEGKIFYHQTWNKEFFNKGNFDLSIYNFNMETMYRVKKILNKYC